MTRSGSLEVFGVGGRDAGARGELVSDLVQRDLEHFGISPNTARVIIDARYAVADADNPDRLPASGEKSNGQAPYEVYVTMDMEHPETLLTELCVPIE